MRVLSGTDCLWCVRRVEECTAELWQGDWQLGGRPGRSAPQGVMGSRAFAEKLQQLRPYFDAELSVLRDALGWGASVDGEHIKILIPRVMARQRAAAQQGA